MGSACALWSAVVGAVVEPVRGAVSAQVVEWPPHARRALVKLQESTRKRTACSPSLGAFAVQYNVRAEFSSSSIIVTGSAAVARWCLGVPGRRVKSWPGKSIFHFPPQTRWPHLSHPSQSRCLGISSSAAPRCADQTHRTENRLPSGVAGRGPAWCCRSGTLSPGELFPGFLGLFRRHIN